MPEMGEMSMEEALQYAQSIGSRAFEVEQSVVDELDEIYNRLMELSQKHKFPIFTAASIKSDGHGGSTMFNMANADIENLSLPLWIIFEAVNMTPDPEYPVHLKLLAMAIMAMLYETEDKEMGEGIAAVLQPLFDAWDIAKERTRNGDKMFNAFNEAFDEAMKDIKLDDDIEIDPDGD